MIYLLTFHGSVNYGAVLQAYALHKTILNLGYDNTVIDYNRLKHHRNFLDIKRGNFKSFCYQLFKFPRKYLLSCLFNYFIKSHLHLTSPYTGKGSLFRQAFKSQDKYLIGSDQVWNLELTGYDLHYFLDFTDSKNKYSYAASFGTDQFQEKDFGCYRKYLSQFKMISMREESGHDFLDRHLGIDSQVVCDPTYLLDKQEWKSILPEFGFSQEYVLVFMLGENRRLMKAAETYARRNHLKLINIVYENTVMEPARNLYLVSPLQWLNYIYHAAAVFTNSFHGISFSLNFEKQVWFSLSHSNRNTRIHALCSRYGVGSHLLDDADTACDDLLDYTEISSKIKTDRKKALVFLRRILQD